MWNASTDLLLFSLEMSKILKRATQLFLIDL